MFRRSIAPILRRMATTSATPMEDAIRAKVHIPCKLQGRSLTGIKLTEALKPTVLEIRNDSHLHSHHKAMQGVTSRETHFALNIVSNAFEGQRQLARHRMVNNLLREELHQEGGIHALQIRASTPEKDEEAKTT